MNDFLDMQMLIQMIINSLFYPTENDIDIRYGESLRIIDNMLLSIIITVFAHLYDFNSCLQELIIDKKKSIIDISTIFE
jgi:hypothetical protein